MSTYRGSRASFQPHRSQGSRFPPPVALPGDRDILQGLSKTPLMTISLISPPNNTEVKITDLQYIGSYNWTNRTPTTIIVPGAPPEWRNRPLPYQVPADTGFFFKHQNGFRTPNAILLPLFIAVDEQAKKDGEDYDWASIDFITDRNNLRKLLRWIAGGSDVKDFRIDVQLAGKRTVLFNRWENRDKEQMSGKTFGFNFEKESTRILPGCEESVGHHRIVQYDMNGLKVVVRFEVDACVPQKSSSKVTSSKAKSGDGLDDLIGALSTVNVGGQKTDAKLSTVTTSGNFPDITVIHAGSAVPQSSILELTTRSKYSLSYYNWQESYPQLFLSQTPHHFLAVHERGRFVEVQKRVLESTELKEITAGSIQGDLKKLRGALDVIKALIVKHGERGRLSLVCQSGQLKVFERVSKDSCLPDEILERFSI